jgi:predicted Zn-dependent protease
VNRPGIGQTNFNTLVTLSDVQAANGKTAEAKATRDKALNHPTASAIDIHQYARLLMAGGKKDDALIVFQTNAKLHPDVWPVNWGLARGYAAVGKYPEALKYAKLALPQAPDDANKKNIEGAIKKLEAGQDIN